MHLRSFKQKFACCTPVITEPVDGGAIVVVETSCTSSGFFSAKLRLKPEKCLEAAGHFKQWFCFNVAHLPVGSGTRCEFSIIDAAESTFSDWSGYNVCATRDRVTWFRVETTAIGDDGSLNWVLEDNATSMITFAYFPLYTLEMQIDQIHSAIETKHCDHVVLGQSEDGRDLNCLVFYKNLNLDLEKHFVVWIQHRQHPGEVSASWFCDGVLSRLMEMSSGDKNCVTGSSLLASCLVVVVPNVNPDGGVRGHLRTNAKGANLNRCWGRLHGLTAPGQTEPPAVEVESMIAGMRALGGVDLMLDIHQDEEKPYVFISKSPLGVECCTPEIRNAREKFHESLRKRSPDFETPGPIECVGYAEPSPGAANLNICSPAVAQAFPGCLSMTMEHPYKGNDNAGPEAAIGFTTQQCVDLGKATVDAVEDVLPFLVRSHDNITTILE